MPARLFADRVFTMLVAAEAVLLALALLFTPAVISLLAPGFREDPHRFAHRRRAHPHHLPLSAAGEPRHALRRHPQCAAPLRDARRRADPAQSVDDGDARARRVLSDRRPRRGVGRVHRRLPRGRDGRRRCSRAATACRRFAASSGTTTSAASSARSGPPPSAPPAPRSRCSPTPSSRASSPPARCRRSITPTGSTSFRSA